jgi:putative sugar O-methyltransferase
VRSECFNVRSEVAKTEYWKYFAEQLHVEVSGSSAQVSGRSGFYVPRSASAVTRLTRKLARGVKQPSEIAKWIGRGIARKFELPRLLSYEDAFDAVMGSADVSMPLRSAFVLDHRRLAAHPNVFASAPALKRHYQQWSGNEASANIVNHYYYQNILRGFVEPGEVATVMEIGGGNGNFASILFHDWAPVRVVLIDLPETLAISIPFLSSLFPQARIVMPHEVLASGIPEPFDFAFLTVDQLHAIADDSIDLAINCHSFQEMTHGQIRIYFELIQRACRHAGLFFTANRVEKIPTGAEAFSVQQLDPPNRMAEYPWSSNNTVLAYEVSRFSRLVQLDGVALRLERVCKLPS